MNKPVVSLGSFLFGVGVTQLIAFPYLQRYHEKSNKDI